MGKLILEKITAFNDTNLGLLGEHNKAVIIKKFTEASIDILDADFGFSWWKETLEDAEHTLIYTNAKSETDVVPHNESMVPNYKESNLTIPITFDGACYGSIGLYFSEKQNFTDQDKSVVTALMNSLTQALIICQLHELKQSEQDMAKMAYYDTVTGIPNRSFLNEKLAEEHRLAEETKEMYALFFIDLDSFKVINDIYGHQVGDTLLKRVAQRIQGTLPKKAVLARMGGDEFLVLLPNLNAVSEAEKCATGILEVFTNFFQIDEHELYVNGSVGFAIFPLDGVSPNVLLKHADLALHRAKDHGGGNFQQYRVGQPLFYTMQPKLQSQLRKAIANEELVLHYQPIVGVRNKRIIGCEALVRWNHPEMGLLYPGDFIGQAEESGLIVQLGQWVINEVCRQIQQWEQEDKIPPPVSINISPRELLRPALVSNIETALKKHKVSPTQIKLELTETFLMKNIDLSIGILEQLRALGLRILIDDFGTGYASLNYLRKLPINGVKIDQSFVMGVPNNLQDAALTSAIIAISHQLGLDVVAEGVENVDQLNFLRAAQCNFAQGNFFFKPVNAQAFADLLRLAHPS